MQACSVCSLEARLPTCAALRLSHRLQCGNECMTCEAPGSPCTACFWGEPDAAGVCPAAVESPPCDVDSCERCAEGKPDVCELCDARSKKGFYSAVAGACVWTPFVLE